jgi:uncharacterized membrane protein YfcA
MSSLLIVGASAFIISGITLFSGFGLGTALMPVFALFFSLEVAIAATAIVHLANNVFKAILVGRFADLKITLLFSLPAVVFALAGAWLLSRLASPEPLLVYSMGERIMTITPIKLVIGFLMAFFSVMELTNALSGKTVSPRLIPLGGAISGFFGGLSGHQGAFRSIFLLKAGLSKEAFIGTTVLSAIVVDVARLAVYGFYFLSRDSVILSEPKVLGHVLVGIVCAFAGIFIGSRLIDKVTYRTVQILVGSMLLLIATGLMTGVL